MALTHVGSFTLGEINIGLMAAFGLLNPLALQLDLFISGQFGLGPFMADLQVQFQAAISAQLSLGIQISDPFAAVRALITAAANLQASLQLALAFGLPTVSIQLSAQLSAALALSASLQLKLGGIKLLLAGAINLKIPLLKLIADLQAALSAGPVHLLSFTGSNLATTGAQISSAFGGGLGPDDPITPGEMVSGVVMIMKDPVVFAALGGIIKLS
jgi:hypothetical protein